MSLSNKVALVTGGSRGIGKAIAITLANAGYPVGLTYNNNHDNAEAVAKALRDSGARAVAVHLSLKSRKSIQQAINTIQSELGQVSILVNNAAISQEQAFETITDDDWDHVLATNLRGPFVCTQEVLPGMLALGWGRIINIVSIGGQWGGFNQVHYAAAKAGLINFTRSVAKIYSAGGITSNAVSPGLVATDMSAAELETEAGKQKVKNIPAGRLGTTEEVAATAAFLCSDKAAYITGQTINLNGGLLFA